MSGKIRNLKRDEDMPSDVSRQPGWGRPRHSADPARAKIPTRRITINLDQDVIAHFKAEALRGGPPYQVGINQAVRRYLHELESRNEGALLEAILAALDNPRVRRKVRAIKAVARAHHEASRRSSLSPSS